MMVDKLFILAWVAVYFCRVVLIMNGIIYAISGVKYYNQSYHGFELRENGISGDYSFPVLEPVIKDTVIQDQFDGLLILAPFMGAAYMCVAFTSIAAAFFFRNPEAAAVLFLQAVFLSMCGCIVRSREPGEFYNDGEKSNVQNSQLVAVITGWIGAVFGIIIPAVSKQKVPTPIGYSLSLYFYMTRKDEGTADSINA